MFTGCKEVEQLPNWSKERHLILLIFCFIRGKCWTRGNILYIVEHGKHFSKSSAPGYMLNGDLLKLFRLRTMTRISHFVCLGKQLYHAHDLKCAEVFISCTWSYFFQDLYIFLHHMLLLEMWISVYALDRKYPCFYLFVSFLLLRRNYVTKSFRLTFSAVGRYGCNF